MKSGVRQVHFRQHEDQHDKKQQGQNEQTRRFYRPASHDMEGSTELSGVKPHERATPLRQCLVGCGHPPIGIHLA